MKKIEKKVLTISIIMFSLSLLTSGITVYATEYLYDSEDVYYDNTNSRLTSSDVQGAISELDTLCEIRCPNRYTCTKK